MKFLDEINPKPVAGNFASKFVDNLGEIINGLTKITQTELWVAESDDKSIKPMVLDYEEKLNGQKYQYIKGIRTTGGNQNAYTSKYYMPKQDPPSDNSTQNGYDLRVQFNFDNKTQDSIKSIKVVEKGKDSGGLDDFYICKEKYTIYNIIYI
jgi:hypothetical protein